MAEEHAYVFRVDIIKPGESTSSPSHVYTVDGITEDKRRTMHNILDDVTNEFGIDFQMRCDVYGAFRLWPSGVTGFDEDGTVVRVYVMHVYY